MYQEIKRLADEAIALQNKLQMESALRTISSICEGAPVAPEPMNAEEFVAAEMAEYKAAVKAARTKDAVVADVYEHVVYGTRDLQARAETPTVTALAAAATSVTIGDALDLAEAKRQRQKGAKQ